MMMMKMTKVEDKDFNNRLVATRRLACRKRNRKRRTDKGWKIWKGDHDILHEHGCSDFEKNVKQRQNRCR